MNTTPEVTAPSGLPYLDITREFDAPPSQVFKAYTDPELMRQWLGPRRLSMRFDVADIRSGGQYRYIHSEENGTEYAFRGVYHTVEAPTTIVQTFEFEGAPGHVNLERLQLEDLGGRTRLVARSVFPSMEAREAALASNMESGIRESMDRLAELLSSTGS